MNQYSARRRTFLLGGLAVLAAPRAYAQRARVLRFGSPQPVGSTYHDAMIRFAAEASRLSNGKLRVETFPNAQLGGIKDMLTAVQLGSLSMSTAVPAWYSGFVKPMDVFTLPYLIASPQRLRAALDGPFGQQIATLAEAANFKLLGTWLMGARHLVNNVHPIYTPANCEGLKLRVISSQVYIRAMKALGANPVVLDSPEIYLAMQQHVVDGLEYPIPDIIGIKLYEVAKYVSLDAHTIDFFFVSMNKGIWDGLTPDDQAIVTEAMKISCDAQWEAQPKATATATETLGGLMQINPITPDQRALFAAKTRPIYQEFAASIGPDLLEQATRQLGTA